MKRDFGPIDTSYGFRKNSNLFKDLYSLGDYDVLK
ncbi:hypothetical protein JOC76_006046 [Neobacillus cucumis]|nr:hypothetical protein [Neobacillus cucumis]